MGTIEGGAHDLVLLARSNDRLAVSDRLLGHVDTGMSRPVPATP